MNDTLNILKELLSSDEAVSFREFVESPDYCNNQDLFEYWYEQDEKLPTDLRELLLDGSLGSGKSTYGAYKFCYQIYRLFHSGSPQACLGLPTNSDIYCLYFSVSITTAKQSGYQLIYDIFDKNKWFQEHAPINTNLKSSVEFIDKHFYIKYASDFGHQISLNVYSFILDEANFRRGVGRGMAEEYAEVTELYQQLIDRQVSRFARPDGTVDAFAMLISSASYQTSFSEKRKQLTAGDPRVGVITSTAYEAKPHRFSKEKFEVFIGAGVILPEIVESEEHKKKLLSSISMEGTGREEEFFRKVPVNLKPYFKTNIVLALQNHCGVPTNLSGAFMSNMKLLYDSYTEDILPILQSFELEASTADDTQLIEYLIPQNVVYAERPHSIFLDLSVQKDTGALSCFRYDGEEDGKSIHTRVFLLKIRPAQWPAATSITKVKNFIIDIANVLNVVAFASDQYQSTELRQDVQRLLGIEDIRISIDSSDIPHLHWQRALADGRLKQIKDEVLEREVQECVHDFKKHRVIKSNKSSDDVFQAEVGGFYLSDTFGKNQADLSDLYPQKRVNLVGNNSMSNILKKLGYDKF